MEPTLVSVRFFTSRADRCGAFHSGLEYAVPPDFAAQVVEREGIAEYVHGPVSPAAPPHRVKHKRTSR